MLNELLHFSKVLDTIHGIKTYDWHKDLKPLPNASLKKPCYKILLDPEGAISGIEPMQPELVACLRKWEQSLGNSFPGFNIQPLFRISDEDKKALLKNWREGKATIDLKLIREWTANKQLNNWDTKFTKKMSKCLGFIPNELNQKCSSIFNKFSAVNIVCERAIKIGDGGNHRFFNEILVHIFEVLERGLSASIFLSVLFHEGSTSKKPEDDRGSVSIFLDVPDWNDYPVANEATIKYINERLFVNPTTKEKIGDGQLDAFGGDSSGCEDKLPEVKLPYINRVILRAMTKESPCQYRYGTVDADSFRIGGTNRKSAKRALEWLADPSREGETWGRADIRELIFAYPTYIPEVPLKLAACLGARKADDNQARFEDYAQDVISNLRGIPKSLKEIEMRVFSLRKMYTTSAKTKVVFHRNYSAQRLADAAREWQTGCANIPIIQMRAWGTQKGQIITEQPTIPFPLQIADCLNRVWKLDGTSICEVQTTPKTAGIELLLDESATRRLVPHMLGVAIQNTKGMFCSLGNSLHQKEIIKFDGYNKQKQLMPPILGLLLWKLGIGKEQYMQNSPYLVGRMLKLADELHALYCLEVRKDSKLPPQMLGNALMTAALDSPTQALAQLALRIVPYLGWARTNSTVSAGLSRYFLKEFGQVEMLLRDKPLPIRLDDKAKAQLLLGYISGNSQTEEQTTK